MQENFMKKLYFPIVSILLVLSACSSPNEDTGSSVISGNVKVITPGGIDITDTCSGNLQRGGLYAQNTSSGTRRLNQITCLSGHDVYRIKGDSMTVNVPGENTNVNFGSVVINLESDFSYKVMGGNGNLKVGDTSNGWSRSFVGGGASRR
jgi:hypothetical protein